MPPSPRQGTGFINWGDYVSANRGAAQRLGDSLTQGVNATGAKARKNLFEAQDTMSSAVRNAESQGATAYTGPASYADIPAFQEGQIAADEAARDAQRLASVYGRMGMLGEQYGATPGYSVGNRAFDAALAGSVGQGGFEAVRRTYSAMPGEYRAALEQSAVLGGQAADRARERGKAPPPQPAPLDTFVRPAPRPIQPEPDLSSDAPWTGKRPRKKNDLPPI